MIALIVILFLGFVIGYFIPLEVGELVKLYLSLSILVTLSSSLEILHDLLLDKKNIRKWTIEFTSNLLLSSFLVFLSLRLAIPLYYAIIIYFGSKIFDIMSKIRYSILKE
ncbi:MAG TPA: DUF1290 domain-containing protein [Clostridia bacterium]|nr:DUF1290 domain-containing protein [Clostridia bacterium]